MRHRRRRLHGHLRRQAPQGRHDRLARGRARQDDEDTLEPYKDASQFTEAYVSGLSVGVPGTVRGWETALKRYGTRSLRSSLRPGERIAREGFVIDPTFNGQVTTNAPIFDDFTSTRELYLDREGREAGRRRPAQPRPGQDLRAHRRRPRPLLPRRDRARHRADRPAPAGGAGLRPPARGAPGPDDRARPQALRRDPPRPDQGQLPRPRRLRHGPAVVGRLDRRRGAEHPRGAAPHRRSHHGAAPLPRGLEARLRRPQRLRRRPERPASTCRCAACSPMASRASAPA